MWISRVKHPTPDKEGLYVVARFVFNTLDNVWTNQMIEFSTDYVYVKEFGGWRPNTMGTPYIEFTHYMSWEDYKKELANLKKG